MNNLTGTTEKLHDDLYCVRGDMENRIKEQQLGRIADRTSCQRWCSNQFRLLPSTLAYVLIDGLRRLGLEGTGSATKQAVTLRARLLKVGAIVMRNTRRDRGASLKHLARPENPPHRRQRLRSG